MIALGAVGLTVGTGSALAAGSCPNAQFRVGASLELPDCRAYEQVSSVNKRGNALKFLTGTKLNPGYASADGGAVMYTPVQGPTTDNAARGFSFPEVATRTADGWATRPVANGPAPQGVLNTASSSAADQIPDASRQNLLFSSGAPFAADQPYIKTSANGGMYLARGQTVDWLSRPTWAGALPAQGTAEAAGYEFLPVGGSEDLSTSYFQTRATLTPEDGASGRVPLTNWALYRWQDGQLSNAAVLPPGSGFPGGIDPYGSVSAAFALGSGSVGGTSHFAIAVQWAYTHAVSRDGAGLLFVSPGPDAGSGRPPQLYLARTGQATVELSKRPEDSAAVAGTSGVRSTGGLAGSFATPGVFAVATPDQRVVVFSTQDALTDAAEAVDPAVVKTYRYDATDGSLTYLPDLDRAASGNLGMVYGLSDDGTRMLYRNAGNELRLWRLGQSTLTLSAGVAPYTSSQTGGGISESRFSTDGHTLILMSKVPLRGEADHPVGGGAGRTQVYRYTEADDRLECVSCAPGITSGPAAFVMQGVDNGFGPGGTAALASTRGMSDDGRAVFFTTTSPLSSDDHNATADVYEWRGGKTHLLSSGATGSLGDYLLDSSASGDDVFIVSRQALTSTDTDDVYDLYDVRVNGGFAPPARAVVPCDGDACQGTVPQDPGPFVGAGSLTFVGARSVPSGGAPDEASEKIRVSRIKTVYGRSTRVKVRVPGKGKLRTSGSGLRRSYKTAKKAGSYRVSVRLSKRARRTLKRKHRVKVRVTVRFTPADGKKQRVRVHATFKPKSAKHKKHRRSSSRSARRVSALSSDARKDR